MSAAFYTHYFAGLCVLVHWFYWWWGAAGVFRMVLPVRGWIFANGVILVLFVPWLPNFLEQLSMKGLEWIPPVTGHAVLSLVWQFTIMNAWGAHSLLLQAIPLVVVFVCAAMLIWKDQSQYRFNGLLIGYFFIPAGVLSLVALVVPVFVPRYLVFAAVGIPFIVAVALDVMVRRTSILVLGLVIVLAAVIQGLQPVYRQVDGLNGTDNRVIYGLDKLAVEIAEEIRPEDEIVVGDFYWYLPFSYYNQTGIQPRVYIRTLPINALELPTHGGYALVPKGQKDFYLNEVIISKCVRRRVWWVAPIELITPFTEKNWVQTLAFTDKKMTALLFTSKAVVHEADSPEAVTPPLFPAAQNCPPAPAATSANKTRH
ncbi:hypothetical protein J3P91_05210 [Pseudomonas sp. Z4-7]|uniref:hypothetical protein n=1 Tax=Pseudomonas sp. Z4-7 TaxID=2817413 RepID=UPI003DAA2CA3